MGYKGVITEGPRHILGWKSPNFIYVNALNPRLKVLMRNFKLSDDISFRFSNKDWSEYPLTAEKYIGWIKTLNPREEIINLFLNYETFGGIQPAETGIFNFLEYFITNVATDNELKFAYPSEIIKDNQPVSAVNVPFPISWADEERDLTAWLGNDMQKEAFKILYNLCERMKQCNNSRLLKDWNYLQASDHFYYMSTKMFSNGEVHSYFNHFDSPYEAFINYMNIMSDFKIRLNTIVPAGKVEQEIAALHQLIDEKDKKIKKMESELLALQRPANPGKSVRIRK
jgi:alpha-amylase